MGSARIEVIGLTGLPEVRPGDDLPALILDGCQRGNLQLIDGDVVVVTQKIVSKSEGCIVPLDTVAPSTVATTFAHENGKDARLVELALTEAKRVVRMDRGILITETRHGFVCANSGVDASNVGAPNAATTLPKRPDASAALIRRGLEEVTKTRVAVVISDTFGRPWREGVTNVAIGIDGLNPIVDYRGQSDADGRSLASTVIAVADELAGAAELVMGKLDRVPVAIVRGYAFSAGAAGGRGAGVLVRDEAHDLFR